MNQNEVMRALESAGTAQTRKVYARHGVSEPMFGVSYAVLGKLRKTIGTDHALALALFDTGIHDARVLATMVVDPRELAARTLDAWAKACDDHAIAAAVGGVAAKSPAGRGAAAKWIRSKNELVAVTGWNAVAGLTVDDAIEDGWFDSLLETIERGIHQAANQARYAMNSALIAIGCRNGFEARAIAAAKRIGPVEVDHGETGCKTPDAAGYIAKTLAHRKSKAGGKKKTTRAARR